MGSWKVFLIVFLVRVVNSQLEDQLQSDAAEVKYLLDEIKVEGLKKFGAFSDYVSDMLMYNNIQ